MKPLAWILIPAKVRIYHGSIDDPSVGNVKEIVVVEWLGLMAERSLAAELRALSRTSLALEIFLDLRILGFKAETGSNAASAAAGSAAQAVE